MCIVGLTLLFGADWRKQRSRVWGTKTGITVLVDSEQKLLIVFWDETNVRYQTKIEFRYTSASSRRTGQLFGGTCRWPVSVRWSSHWGSDWTSVKGLPSIACSRHPGASSGIGRATAVEFAKHGVKVAIAGRNAERLEETAQLCYKEGLKEKDVNMWKIWAFENKHEVQCLTLQ